MKINVDLNSNSIQNAINALRTAQKQLDREMPNDFLKTACEWIRERANANLESSTIGSGVKADIQSSWVIGAPSNGTITMTNTADKAVYVEFGVGVVGAQNKHDNADETGYEYNVPSESKSANGRWVFASEDKTLIDLPIDSYKTKESKDKDFAWIITKGTKGAMYAYNAIVDFRDYGAKEVWQKIKVKYWG